MEGYRYAFSLTKEEVKAAAPPGTTVLIGQDTKSAEGVPNQVQVGAVRKWPVPSLDPADPLNWPTWRKYSVLVCMSLWAWLSNFQAAGISSALPLMVPAFIRTEGPLPFPTLTRLISVNVLLLGVSNIWWVPLANTYGRRSVTLFTLVLLTAFSIWAASAKSYDSLLAARLCMGLAAGPAETVAPDVVGEVFFIHERGRAMAVYTLFLALGPIVGGISGGYIAGEYGWRWINWINAIMAGSLLLLCFLLQPETLFLRQDSASAIGEEMPRRDAVAESAEERTPFLPFTFSRSLKTGMNRGRLSQEIIRPWSTLRLPGVWVVMLQYAGLVASIVTISTVAPQIVSAPPYLWGKDAGLINIGGLIGTFLGGFYTFVVADLILKSEAQKERHGYSEPESRLKTQFPALTLGTFGLWIFGAFATHPGPRRWVGLQFGYGMLAFALMQAPSVGFNYIIDAYNSVSSDCFVMVVLVRAIISFAWTYFVADWVHDRGPMEPFGIFGMLMAVFTLLTIPQAIWGKRTRIATAKWLPIASNH